jgi:hypothetical protein
MMITNADGSITVDLKYPVPSEGETKSTITLRRPRIKELRAMDAAKGNVSATALLIGALAAWAPSSVDLIDAADFNAISEGLQSFLPQSPPTGETP